MTRGNLIAGLAWMGLAVLCWTPLFSVAKRTLPYLDAFALGSVRYLIGVALFVGLLAAVEGRQALRYDGRLGAATLFGLIGITGFNLFSGSASGSRARSMPRSSSRCRRRSPRSRCGRCAASGRRRSRSAAWSRRSPAW